MLKEPPSKFCFICPPRPPTMSEWRRSTSWSSRWTSPAWWCWPQSTCRSPPVWPAPPTSNLWRSGFSSTSPSPSSSSWSMSSSRYRYCSFSTAGYDPLLSGDWKNSERENKAWGIEEIQQDKTCARGEAEERFAAGSRCFEINCQVSQSCTLSLLHFGLFYVLHVLIKVHL